MGEAEDAEATLTAEECERVARMMEQITEALLGDLHLPAPVRFLTDKASDLAKEAARKHPAEALERLRAMRNVLDAHRDLLSEAREPQGPGE